MPAGFQRVQQMKCRNRPARPVSLIAISRNDKRGASVTFDNSGRSDSNDATMPTFAVDDHTKRVSQSWLTFDALSNRRQYPALLFLTLAVELVKFGCDFAGAS